MYTWLQIATSADLEQLVDNISPEYKPEEVAKKLQKDISNAVKSVLIEDDYIDKDYRSTYYNFYAKKALNYNPNCSRLHFFDETVSFDEEKLTLSCSDNDERLDDHYFGYMILRPTGIATIGRSVLSPDIRNGARGGIILANHKVHLLGYTLFIEGFPSMDQHIDISVCAHVACWCILRHYSERYSTHSEFHVHDITLMAHQFNPGGLIPSKGLEISHAERVFQEAGTYPVYIAREDRKADAEDASFYRQLYAYIESGFPLFSAIHTRSHAIAVIGSKLNAVAKLSDPGPAYGWDQIESLVVVDDNHLPYLSIPIKDDTPKYKYCAKDIDSFIVALPEKVFYPADAVDRLAPTLYMFSPIIELPPKNSTIVRYFITTGSGFRRFVRQRASEFDGDLLKICMTLPFAQFLWIIEYSTDNEWAKGQISARAVVDATASLRDVAPIWLFHNRARALYFENRTVASESSSMEVLGLKGMDKTALTRMDQNMRQIKPK